METQERILGGVLGLAVGDALGVPVEFSERNALRRKPVTGMQGGGYHRQPAGTWWTAALARVEEIRERAGRLHRLCVAAPAFADSYWILPGKLLAGEYPGARKAEEAERKLKSLQETGVNFVVDLTEEGERAGGAPLLLYHGLLDHRCEVARCPMPDGGISGPDKVQRALDLDEALAKGKTAYVHCWGGHGRTGVVAGCWLQRHGLADSQHVLEMLAQLRKHMPDAGRLSPETEGQRRLVQQRGRR